MFKAILLTLALAIAVPVHAQTCDRTISQSPTVRGLKLGMTEADLRTTLKLADAASSLSFIGNRDLRKVPAFDGVDALEISTFEGKLSNLVIRYSRSIRWPSNMEFAERMSEALSLPAARTWVDLPNGARLECKEFVVRAWAGMNTLELEDRVAQAKELKAKADADEQKRRTFKP